MREFSQVKQYVINVPEDNPWFQNPPNAGDEIACEQARYGKSIVTQVQISEDFENALRGEIKRTRLEIYSIS